MKNKLILHYRDILLHIVYLIFAIFSIWQILNTDKLSSQILYGAIAVVFLGMAVYAEYLRHLYQKAIKILLFDVDPKRAEQQFQFLLKKDFFHAYQNSKAIFDTLYYADEMDASGCLQTLEVHDRFFHGSLDQLLIYHYTRFFAYVLQRDQEQLTKEYAQLQKMKGTKIKGQKLSPLYNWDFIDALYQLSKKEYKKSLNTFNHVHTENMNNRELMHLYFFKGVLLMKMSQKKKAADCFKQAANNEGSSRMKEYAKQYEKKVNV